MMARLGRILALVVFAAFAGACQSQSGPGAWIESVMDGSPNLSEEGMPTIAEQLGEGRTQVFGASVYSPGQKIYKELRQQDSLMAFLACQGEPDRVEVLPGEDGSAPRILLEYRRKGLRQTGTVTIEESPDGFYAARPIDPKGLSGRRTPPPPQKKPAPKPAPKPESLPPSPLTPPPPAPSPQESGAVSDEAPEAPPLPTQDQLDECPIEYWRDDCRELCIPDAPWEWCAYEG